MYFWFDWLKTENPLSKPPSINKNEQIKKIKNLRKMMTVTAIPLWIFSILLLMPSMMDYHMFGNATGFDFANNFFKFGMVFGILGIIIIAIGIILLFTIQQKLDLYYLAEKQLQFS
jgi:preprotein translocase subunit SecF